MFSLEEGAGILFKALAAFALRGIRLTKVIVIFIFIVIQFALSFFPSVQ